MLETKRRGELVESLVSGISLEEPLTGAKEREEDNSRDGQCDLPPEGKPQT
jgi:hypothetical protein